MAGGIGSRFWPMSTSKHPKQFHDMLGVGKSLLQQTFHRFLDLIPHENIYISTNEKYLNLVLEQLPMINKNQVLLEPKMRNTAPCILYACSKISHLNKNANIIVAPSDHYIENEKEFLKNVATAFDKCTQEDCLVTLGIKPSSPNTGYGYIAFAEGNSAMKKVQNFTEKPNIEKAKEFLAQGNYLWNAGIFIWSAKSILKAFEAYLPAMNQLFSKGKIYWNTTNETTFLQENYPKAENISIDFGIMEKAKNVYVLPVEFGWNDLGTWGSLYDKLPKGKEQNAVVNAEAIFRDATNNMVRTTKGKHVVIQGLSDFIVVEKDDVLLICPKSQEQEIKQIVNSVKEKFEKDIT